MDFEATVLIGSFPSFLAADRYGADVVQEAANLHPAQPGQIVVLIAEDEAIVREFARVVLEGEGYFVITANDGEQALSMSRQYPGPIHILLSDLRMPNLDGLELRRRLSIERPQIRVLLMSGHIENPGEDVPFLAKPFGPAELRQRMRSLLVCRHAANREELQIS